MAKPTFQAIRGMSDILPDASGLWQLLEETVYGVLCGYGYQEIRLPLLEKTELFARSIGEVTDIVEKEMYSFADRGGESLTLRPEGTAGCLRACLEHGLLHNKTQRLWYRGPMFRYERPQKGRYRQFHQIGVEAYGMTGPDIDAELICLSARMWERLGIEDVTLQINSLGSSAARAAYREHLVAYFKSHQNALDEDSQRRLHTNPLRILDSKNPEMQRLLAEAPVLLDHLDLDSEHHFNELRAMLDSAKIQYEVNPHLVRGLDYYSQTVFEWVTDSLGAQGTICAGGRYDGLVTQLGGKALGAVGFAMGVERLIAMLMDNGMEAAPEMDTYLIALGEAARAQVVRVAEYLRNSNIWLQMHCGSGSLKTLLRHADQSGARFALILGEDEVHNDQLTIKPLREKGTQQITLPLEEAAVWLNEKLNQELNQMFAAMMAEED